VCSGFKSAFRNGEHLVFALKTAGLSGESILYKAVTSNKPDVVRAVPTLFQLSNLATSASSFMSTASNDGHPEVVQALLDIGANVDHRLRWLGFTALHYASSTGHVAVVRVLLDAGAEVDACTGATEAPLHLACMHGHVDVVNALVGAGADVNRLMYVHRDGMSPIYFASDNGHVEVARALLQAGANVDIGECPIRAAAKKKNNRELVRLLRGLRPRSPVVV
jgi:ankyrin repeat protein